MEVHRVHSGRRHPEREGTLRTPSADTAESANDLSNERRESDGLTVNIPVEQLTVRDVSRLTEQRRRAREQGDEQRVEEIDAQLTSFLSELSLPDETLTETLKSRPTRRFRMAHGMLGIGCGAGIGFTMGGTASILAGAILGYVLVVHHHAGGAP